MYRLLLLIAICLACSSASFANTDGESYPWKGIIEDKALTRWKDSEGEEPAAGTTIGILVVY